MTVFTLPEFGNKKHFTVMTSFHFELTLKREEWNGLGITRPHSYIFYPALYKESRPFIHDVNWPWAIIHGSPSHLLSFIVLHLILIIIISEWSTWTIADSAQEEFCPTFHCGHTPQTVTTTWAPAVLINLHGWQGDRHPQSVLLQMAAVAMGGGSQPWSCTNAKIETKTNTITETKTVQTLQQRQI